MKEFDPTQNKRNNPEAIKNLLAHLVEATPESRRIKSLEKRAAAAWEDHPELELTQDQVTGRFRRESVFYCLGSLPGFSVFVEVETVEGPQDIQLFLKDGKPAFDIKPVVLH